MLVFFPGLPPEQRGIPYISKIGIAFKEVNSPRLGQIQCLKPGTFSRLPGTEEKEGSVPTLQPSMNHLAKLYGIIASM